MSTQQGDVSLLNDPVAQELLKSSIPASLSYVWTDGTPRVVPIWFHWNGKELVFGSPPGAPKIKAIQHNSHVAVSIDSRGWPYKVLLIRGPASVEMVNEGTIPEYEASALRYFGEEAGTGWINQMKGMSNQMARISLTPKWVGILDFETRFPAAVAALMSG
jgi:hypothetical protein